VAVGDETVLRNLKQLCARDAQLFVVIGIDVEKDRSALDRLALTPLKREHLSAVLPTKYARAGFETIKTELVTGAALAELKTSWARRLKTGHNRSYIRIVARLKSKQ
jgi:hypothetical protein